MNRNWDLIRQILLMADGRSVDQVKADLGGMGYTEADVDFHLAILGTGNQTIFGAFCAGEGEAGFITLTSTFKGGHVEKRGDLMMRVGMEKHVAMSRTWEGSEIFSLIANDEMWFKIQSFCGFLNVHPTEQIIRAAADRVIASAFDLFQSYSDHLGIKYGER